MCRAEVTASSGDVETGKRTRFLFLKECLSPRPAASDADHRTGRRAYMHDGNYVIEGGHLHRT